MCVSIPEKHLSRIVTTDGSQPFTVAVTKGRTYVQLQTCGSSRKTALNYALRTDFVIYTDPFEDNDKQYKAFTLPERSQTIRGTFHEKGDLDWFALIAWNTPVRCVSDYPLIRGG